MFLVSAASADTFGTGANQFTIDFVTISGATNPASGISAGQGFTFIGVNNDYRMGVYEITNDQWNKFQVDYGVVTGSPLSAYRGTSVWKGANVPTNEVSWYEAAQFVNWLNTSTGHQAAYKFTGTQGTSDYTFATWSAVEADGTNLYRHKDAFYFLPTNDEWVKAAYWNGTSLQTYANASPGDIVSGLPDKTKWNSNASGVGQPWNVGSGSEELNGTFDMMGNVWEWTESPSVYNAAYHGTRGGSYFSFNSGYDYGYGLSSNIQCYSYSQYSDLGFRVASAIPEPMALGLGVVALLRKRKIDLFH
jgi:formylglycine-generating enzyme required for sulfatase activity